MAPYPAPRGPITIIGSLQHQKWLQYILVLVKDLPAHEDNFSNVLPKVPQSFLCLKMQRKDRNAIRGCCDRLPTSSEIVPRTRCQEST